MTEPTRTSTGIAYLTFDATLNTDASMIIQQKLDLSGNTTAQTFCENAFNLAAGEDISGVLLSDSDITDYNSNNLVYLASNDVNVQKTFLSANENSTKAQLIALNAYDMTLGKNNQIPLVSNLKVLSIVGYSLESSNYLGAGAGFAGDGSNITANNFRTNQLENIAFDSQENMYIVDKTNNRIRKLTKSTGLISTIAGNLSGYGSWWTGDFSGDGGLATSSKMELPYAVAVDSNDNIYIGSYGNCCLRKVNASDGKINTIGGVGGRSTQGYEGDGGPATSAKFNYINDIATDSYDNIYLCETNNAVIRKIDVSTGIVSTIAGTGTHGFSGDGGAATSAQFSGPYSFDIDSFNSIYIADRGNHRIRKIDASTGIISTIAGTGERNQYGESWTGDATDASLNYPVGIKIHKSAIYFCDMGNSTDGSYIRKIDMNTGIINTIASGFMYNQIKDIEFDSSDIMYLCENHAVRKLTPIYE